MLAGIFGVYKVRIAYIFGSEKDSGCSFLEGLSVKTSSFSDLDIGVVFDGLPEDIFNVYGGLYADLSVFFESFKIDLVFLEETDALFQYEAITGSRIYCEDEDFCDDYEEMVMKLASDLLHKKASFKRDFFEAIKDGYFEIAIK